MGNQQIPGKSVQSVIPTKDRDTYTSPPNTPEERGQDRTRGKTRKQAFFEGDERKRRKRKKKNGTEICPGGQSRKERTNKPTQRGAHRNWIGKSRIKRVPVRNAKKTTIQRGMERSPRTPLQVRGVKNPRRMVPLSRGGETAGQVNPRENQTRGGGSC